MKDVYFDLFLLERYVASGIASAGVSLVMNDMEHLVNPRRKVAKCWRYDISQGATCGDEIFETPIGGGQINFWLEKRYTLSWKNYGVFWFLEAEGIDRTAAESNDGEAGSISLFGSVGTA